MESKNAARTEKIPIVMMLLSRSTCKMKMNTSEGGRCDVDGRGDEYDHNDRGNVRLHTNAANANINLSHTHTHTHTHTRR